MTISDALAGRDVCGKAKTGSGKTLGFGLPMLQRLSADPTLGVENGQPAKASRTRVVTDARTGRAGL